MNWTKKITSEKFFSIIAILLLIVIITIPSIIAIKNNINIKKFEKVEERLIESAKKFYKEKLENTDTYIPCFTTLEELSALEYLDTPILNPKNNMDLDLNYRIIIREEKNQINYEYVENYYSSENIPRCMYS